VKRLPGTTPRLWHGCGRNQIRTNNASSQTHKKPTPQRPIIRLQAGTWRRNNGRDSKGVRAQITHLLHSG